MQPQIRTFLAAKAGNDPTEYEDAYWVSNYCEHDPRCLRLAVADGATETSFSGLWARLLVRSYGKGWPRTGNCSGDISWCRKAWARLVRAKPLPWYAEEKLNLGAYSSLTGLTIVRSTNLDGGSWFAIAVGDSCLYQVRAGKLITSFPLNQSRQFDSRPTLIGSTSCGFSEEDVTSTSGPWQTGDVFLLMTDALACWFLRKFEEGTDPTDKLLTLDDQAAFDVFLAEERAAPIACGTPSLRNDDVTLVQCTIL